MSTYVAVTWTTGDVITEAKMDNMVANDQSEDAHAANGMIMNNNVPYSAEQADTTKVDLMKLGTDDILKLSQLRLQDDDGNSITTTTKEGLRIDFGWVQVVGSGANSSNETVTFSPAFNSILWVLPGTLGAKTGAAADITELTLESVCHVQAEDITNASFAMRWNRQDDEDNMSGTSYYGASWIALGT